MARSRPIFNFFADLGEQLEDAPRDESALKKARPKLFLLVAFFAAVMSSLLAYGVYRERVLTEREYASLTWQLSKVVADRSLPSRAGEVQNVDFSKRVATVNVKNEGQFAVTIGPDTNLFIYLPSKRRLVRLQQGDVEALLRGDKVAFLQEPSGKTVAMVITPSPSKTPTAP
jgi:hypothetical protein